MTTSDDPLTTWLRWFEHQHPEAWTSATGRQEALAQWEQVLGESLEQLAQTLTNTVDWQASLAAHVRIASEDAARLAPQIATPPFLDLLELSQRLFSCQSDTASSAGPTPSLATGLFGHLTSWPILGLASAHEHDWRNLQESIPAVRCASERYAQRLLAMMTGALERWQISLLQSATPPADAGTLRELWLEALESAWQAMLENPEHARLLLELNTAMDRVRTHAARVANSLLRTFGMPTREDLLGTQQRLHELRRKLNGRERAAEIAILRKDVDGLREELDALRNGIADSGHKR